MCVTLKLSRGSQREEKGIFYKHTENVAVSQKRAIRVFVFLHSRGSYSRD
jgi:hypothetical protein